MNIERGSISLGNFWWKSVKKHKNFDGMDRANLLAQAVLGPENTPANFDIVEEFVDAEEIVEPVENFDIAGALENYDRLSNCMMDALLGIILCLQIC